MKVSRKKSAIPQELHLQVHMLKLFEESTITN
jgi:hypothetical protein